MVKKEIRADQAARFLRCFTNPNPGRVGLAIGKKKAGFHDKPLPSGTSQPAPKLTTTFCLSHDEQPRGFFTLFWGHSFLMNLPWNICFLK